MSEICTTCGLPKELCVCESIAKETQTITVFNTKKKYGKVYTCVEGIDSKEIDLKDLTKKLKNELACGGALKDGTVELQGEHKVRIRDILIKLGFPTETIVVKK